MSALERVKRSPLNFQLVDGENKLMRRRLIALGLDSVDPDWLLDALKRYQLPNLQRLHQSGTFCRLENHVEYAGGTAPYSSTEGSWVSFQTGVKPNTSGYWNPVTYDPQTYQVNNSQKQGRYHYNSIRPFYKLGNEYRAIVFDIPVSENQFPINGVQINGWGGHFPYTQVGSQPKPLMRDLTQQYGRNPILYRDSGAHWNQKYVAWLESSEIESIRTRSKICCDLLRREDWDLFIAVFGETHGALHDLWFASDPEHPIHGLNTAGHDPLRAIFQALDQAIGEIWQQAVHLYPEDAIYFACFSAHGMKPNATDLHDFVFLPELLYRFNFPGRTGLASQPVRAKAPPLPVSDYKWPFWPLEMWRQRSGSAWQKWADILFAQELHSPFSLSLLLGEDSANWMPTVWYRSRWPEMRAFALPSFADGHIRINLQGREAQGIVAVSDYETECQRVTQFLRGIRNGRTGQPLVRGIIRTRHLPNDDAGHCPYADLIVVWDKTPVDVVVSPEVGQVGPAPYYRTGGHHHAAFLVLNGPGISPGLNSSQAEAAETIDLPPTFLHILNASIPNYLEGKSLFRHCQFSDGGERSLRI